MRRFLCLLLLLAMLPAAHADGNFAGVWTAAVCPRGVANEPGKCAQFVLELYQKQNKVCGAHVFATSGASMVDEAPNPSAPSVSGDIADDMATVSVASTRSKAPRGVQAELKLSHGTLLWKRVDKPGRDELIPATAQFTRSRHKTLMAPVFAQQLAAACSLVAIPEEPKPPQEQPREAPRTPENAPPPEPRKES
jgi:hypothetical protein